MTTSFHKGPARTGFTLIELLVVVLIIGILSSIALPQYTKAVEKARMAEAKIVLKNILDSVERYHLESDDMPNIATDLDITPPGDCDASGDGGAGACMTKNFYYHGVGYECPPDVNVGSCAMLCATRNGTHTDICLCGPNCAIDPPGRFFCLSGNINDEDSACKSLGAVKESHSYFFN